MGKRKQVALFFSYSENWIAGAYYIINLVSCLKLLPDDQQPHLTLIVKNPDDIKKAQEIHYPYMEFQQIEDYSRRLLKRFARVAVRTIFKKEIFKPSTKDKYANGFFEAMFPSPILFDGRMAKKVIYWIYDFQEEHLPQFFSQQEIDFRRNQHKQMAYSGNSIIFSSHDAQKDFIKLYADNNVRHSVLNFAVVHPEYTLTNFSLIQKKYNLPPSYFFCPNQFWAHKNHKIVLAALQQLKTVYGKEVKIVFSGKEHDYRNPGYFDEIKSIVHENNLQDNVFLLGFIDRVDQLQIMKNAVAVIQPSLFEGWSTVVEDAKSMNQNLIVSEIAVHKEQLGNMAAYFDPYDAGSLAQAISNFQKTNVDFNYKEKQLCFGKSFLDIVMNNNNTG